MLRASAPVFQPAQAGVLATTCVAVTCVESILNDPPEDVDVMLSKICLESSSILPAAGLFCPYCSMRAKCVFHQPLAQEHERDVCEYLQAPLYGESQYAYLHKPPHPAHRHNEHLQMYHNDDHSIQIASHQVQPAPVQPDLGPVCPWCHAGDCPIHPSPVLGTRISEKSALNGIDDASTDVGDSERFTCAGSEASDVMSLGQFDFTMPKPRRNAPVGSGSRRPRDRSTLDEWMPSTWNKGKGKNACRAFRIAQRGVGKGGR